MPGRDRSGRRSRRRKALALATSAAASVVLVELVVRLVFAFQVGPRLLLYGTPWHRRVLAGRPAAKPSGRSSVQSHRRAVGDYVMYSPERTEAYSLYFPYETKTTWSPDHRTLYQVHINRWGFRGPDFEIEKAPGTIRVLTLGASSTFGYHNRDDETYPHYLQATLERRVPDQRFEVINFAIPHATTDNIVAMFRAEGLRLDPDVVTLYAGVNDSAVLSPPQTAGQRALAALGRRLLFVRLIRALVPRGADPAFAWSEQAARVRTRVFLENAERVRSLCAERGILFLVATQQAKSGLVPPERMRGLSYEEEVALVRRALARGEIGPGSSAAPSATGLAALAAGALNPARVLLVHAHLMAALRSWAAREGVPLADVIAALDDRRDLLLSWVHLDARANRVVAETLADAILAELRRPPGGKAGR